jgi:four helix bundle protein
MQDFRNLKVWEKGHQLTLSVYREITGFPREEVYGLTAQMRQSAQSVPTNLAEGCGRGTDADFARFVQMSMGSACELEYQLLLSRDLSYLKAETYETLNGRTVEVKRMLGALLQRLHT